MMRTISLRTKFLGIIIGLIVLVGLASIGFVRTIVYHKLANELQKKGVFIAEHIAEESTSAILTEDILALQTLAIDYKKFEEDIVYIFFLDYKGEVLAHTFGETFPKDLIEANIISPTQIYNIQSLATERGAILDIAVPVLKGEAGVVRVGILQEPVKRGVENIVKLIIWGIIGISILGGIVAITFAGTITKPISKLTKIVEAIGGGDLEQKVHINTRDEIGRLGVAFNKMSKDIKGLLQKKEELTTAAIELAERESAKADELEKAYHELRDTQMMLVQSEKLSALGELGAGVAHELNSPLAGVLSLIRTYLKEKDPGSEEYQDLKDMQEACEHMAKIIKDFSTFTRKSTGELTDVNITDVIESTLSFSARQIEKQGIKIEKDYDNNLPLIKGDESQLRQVVLNMVTNARDAISGEGTLKIVTRKSNTDKGQFVEIEFSDTGVGISKEDIGRIFDPFFTTKRPGKGVGLGLSITHTIVKNHNGEILVDSEVGKGSTFIIRLPVTNEK